MKKAVFLTLISVFILCNNAPLFARQVQDADDSGGGEVTIHGVGRAVVTNNRLSGDLLRGDSTSVRRESGGFAQVDMAVSARPNKVTEAKVILRLRNELGGFFGEGSSISVRKLSVKGEIADSISYELGDMDLKLTPYTVFNPHESVQREAEVFRIRRDLVHYENFNIEDFWRVQGVQSRAKFSFNRHVERLSLLGFVVRTRETNITDTPDRLLAGGRFALQQSKFLTVGGTYVNHFDVDNTAKNNTEDFKNQVYSGDFKFDYEGPRYQLSVFGEVGLSRVNYGQPDSTFDNSVFDFGISYEPQGLRFQATYRDVGPRFVSAAAQTRRIDFSLPPLLFPASTENRAARRLTLYDELSQEGIFNQAVSPTLLGFNPKTNNTTPYGRATPNRRGITLEATTNDFHEDFSGEAAFEWLKEIRGEGTEESRSFLVLDAGVDVNIDRLAEYENNFTFYLGVRSEFTTRGGTPVAGGDFETTLDKVDFNSTLLDIGIVFGLTRQLDLTLGFKSLFTSGNEFIAIRDDRNQITDFVLYDADETETLLGLGAKYNIGRKTFLSIQTQFFNFSDNSQFTYSNLFPGDGPVPARDAYKISEVFLYYTMTF